MGTKTSDLGRRAFLGGIGFGLVNACTHAGVPSRSESNSAFAEIETHLGGRLGVAALDTQNGMQLSYRGDERFAMCSSYKWILTALVLARADKGEIALGQPISYSTADLIDFSPVT